MYAPCTGCLFVSGVRYNPGNYCKVKNMSNTEQNSEAGLPFGEACNTARFFTGGGRGAVLDDIQAALAEQIDVVTLIGEEGSGKTVLCKKLYEQLRTVYTVIYLPQILGSFEAIARETAKICGVEYPAETNRADARRIFLDIVTSMREKGERLLILHDEAENMYLATLERLRKILDDVKEAGGGLQLCFAGRKSFRGSLEQLGLCDFNEVAEKQFFLSTLDDNETWEYLNFCVQGLRGETAQEVFTQEAAAKIASMGRGNLRLINELADDSLQSSSADTSFLVLLDHVRDDGGAENLLPETKSLLEKIPVPPKVLIAGGVVCFLLLLVLIFSGGEDEEMAGPAEEGADEIIIVDVPEPLLNQTEPAGTSPVVQAVDDVTRTLTHNEPASPPVVIPQESVEEIVTEGIVQEKPPAEEQPKPVAISPVEIVEKKKIAVAEVEPEGPKRIMATKVKRIVQPSAQPVVQPKPSVVTTPSTLEDPFPVVPSFPVDPALEKLVIAGDRWLAGKDSTGYSIQLMALKSEQAEENLKRILAKPEYQKVVDKLVMLKRPSTPPVVLVFYGIYPDMASARNARNNMPIFLRDRHPYPVSVRGAVEKARAE